jgi:PAS domain-containing protein
MESGTFFSRSRYMRAGSFIDWLLYAFAVYVVPALIALATVATLLWAPRQFQSAGAVTLALHVVPDKTASLTPAEALAALKAVQHAPATKRYSTRLAESPFWFLFDVPPAKPGRSSAIEFPSRHAQTLACWNAATLAALGQADRRSTSGDLSPVKAGFTLSINPDATPSSILCRGTFSGPAYLNVLAWDGEALSGSALDFQVNSALIAGGLLTLAVFVFVTALINRELTYVIFAAWLVGNLRLCANAMGWDMEWIDRIIPPEYMPSLRQYTFAVYYLLTGALFNQLFRRELKVVGYRWMLRTVLYAGLLNLIAAAVLPYSQFIPVMWAFSSIGMGVLIFLLARLVWMTRSRTVLWYVASMVVVLFSIFSEVLGAAFGIKLLFGGVNPVIAALSSSMMAAFAIAEQMRAERERRRRMQTELRNTYDVTPIGLFTLDENGHFVRANPALRSMLDLRKGEYRVRLWKDYFEPGAWGSLQALAQKGSEGELELGGSLEWGTAERRYSLKATRCRT